MTKSHGQNSALSSTVKPLQIALYDHKILIYEKWHHFNAPHIIPNRKLHTISFQMPIVWPQIARCLELSCSIIYSCRQITRFEEGRSGKIKT